MEGRLRSVSLAFCCIFAAGIGTGCMQTNMTQPKRSAVEELLFSTAADRAWDRFEPTTFKDKKVYVDSTYFESEDRLYALGQMRDVLSSHGALLVAKAEDADIILEPRNGAFSIDYSESLIGLPKMPLPIPFAGVVQTPELALFKSEKQFSIAKFAFVAYEQKSRKHVMSSGPLVGRANMKYFKILGIAYTKTSIPEKGGKDSSEKKGSENDAKDESHSSETR
jgi:hypothetical protein